MSVNGETWVIVRDDTKWLNLKIIDIVRILSQLYQTIEHKNHLRTTKYIFPYYQGSISDDLRKEQESLP